MDQTMLQRALSSISQGVVNVKGKGEMEAWLVESVKNALQETANGESKGLTVTSAEPAT